MRASRCPSHLLLLYEPFADDLIDCRFHEASADSFTVAVTLAVIRNEAAIALNVRGEFLNRFEQLARGFLLAISLITSRVQSLRALAPA